MKNCSLALVLSILFFAGCKNSSTDFTGINSINLKMEFYHLPADSITKLILKRNYLKAKNDSLELLEVLGTVKKRIQNHEGLGSLNESLSITPSQCAPQYHVDIHLGHLFQKNQIHALVRVAIPNSSPTGHYVYIFQKINKQLRLELEDSVYYMSFVKDTVFDVNRDGSKDYIIQTYPASGCCLAHGFHVRLRNSKSQLFEPSITFLNATFDPKNRIVRGFDYDHPGEVELYKYRWRGMKLDTIEYIMHHPDKKGYYLQSKTPNNYRQGKAKGRVLNKLPREYHEIKGIGWFGIN